MLASVLISFGAPADAPTTRNPLLLARHSLSDLCFQHVNNQENSGAHLHVVNHAASFVPSLRADPGDLACATQWATMEPFEQETEALQALQRLFTHAARRSSLYAGAKTLSARRGLFALQRARDTMSAVGCRRDRAPLLVQPIARETEILRETADYCLHGLLSAAVQLKPGSLADQRLGRRPSELAKAVQPAALSPPKQNQHENTQAHITQHVTVQHLEAEYKNCLARLRAELEAASTNGTYSSAPTAQKRARERQQQLQLEEESKSAHSRSHAFYPGEASRNRVLLAAARMPPGTVSDIDYSRYIGGSAVPVNTRQLPFYLDLMPSLVQLFIEYTPGSVQFGQQRGVSTVLKVHERSQQVQGRTDSASLPRALHDSKAPSAAAVMKMEEFVARGLAARQSTRQVRLPEAGLRAMLLDLDICPRMVQAVDVTVLILMTKLGCSPALEHAKLATQGGAQRANHTAAGSRQQRRGVSPHRTRGEGQVPAVSTSGIADKTRQLALTAVPFAVVAAGGAKVKAKAASARRQSKLQSLGDGDIMMSADALKGNGELSLDFAQFVDVLGRCALLATAGQAGGAGAPVQAAAALAHGESSDSSFVMGLFFINDLQLHDYDIWSAKVPSTPWFAFFEEVNHSLRSTATQREASAGFAAKSFQFTSKINDLLREPSVRYCIQALFVRYSDVHACMSPKTVLAFVQGQQHHSIGDAIPERGITEAPFLKMFSEEILGPFSQLVKRELASNLIAEALKNASLAFRACESPSVLLRKSMSLRKYQIISSKFSSEPDLDKSPLDTAVRRVVVLEHKWRDLFARTALGLAAAQSTVQAAPVSSKLSPNVVISFDGASQLAAVQGTLLHLGISESMPRSATRAWVARHQRTSRSRSTSPILATGNMSRPATAPGGRAGSRLGRVQRAQSFNSSVDLQEASWVGMKALKQLGERRQADPGRSKPRVQGSHARTSSNAAVSSRLKTQTHTPTAKRVQPKHSQQTGALPTQYLP